MRFLLLSMWFLLSFAAFPGAEPAGAFSADTHSTSNIDVGVHDIMCGEGGGHGPCQWVFALAASARPPGLTSVAYASGPSPRTPRLRDICPEQTRSFPVCFMETL